MGIEIPDMVDGAPADGTEIIPTSKAAAPRRLSVTNIKTFVIDQIEAIAAAGSVAAGNAFFMLQAGVMKPVDIDVVTQYAMDTLWGKTPEAAPDSLDVIPLLDSVGLAEKTVTLALLAEYVRATAEAAILDISDLPSGTIALTDYMLVTQTTTAKKVTVQNVYDAIYTGLAAHVDGLTGTVTAVATDEIYFVRAGGGGKMTLAELAIYINASVGVTGSGTTDFLTQWATSSVLKAGPVVTLGAAGFGAGSDSAIPTSLAVRKELNEVVSDSTAQADALDAADHVLVYDASAAANRKATLTQLKTFLDTEGVYKTLWIPYERFTPSQTAGATITDSIESAVNKITRGVAIFDGAAADESVEFDFAMPEDWDLGTIKWRLYWTNGHADADPNDYIEFSLAVGALSNNEALDAALGTPQVIEDQHISDGGLHISAASAALTVGASPVARDMLHWKLTRNYDYFGAGNPMDVDCYVFGVLIQYLANVAPAAW